MSYYTRYRPQTIAELDLLAVRTQLGQILSSGKFSHAYLFSGPKGTGKTSSARILAKVLNCEKNKERVQGIGNGVQLVEPCNECDMCRRITNGSSLVCMEMDAASNRGIDDIRTLRERIGLAPAEGVMAVYIIDEVHMLTTEAFNALLKTLEEPPAHAVFILCTTDPEKIPDTVISRCTRIQFQKATVAEIVGSLAKAVRGEKLTIAPEVLESIALRVDGSFRDGMKTLEQLAQSGKQIDNEMVDEATGHNGDYDPSPLITALRTNDVTTALAILSAMQTVGLDVGVYARRLVEEIRRQLLALLATTDRNAQSTMVELASQVEAAAVAVRRATIPVLPLELMVARWCLQAGNRDQGTGSSKVQGTENRVQGTGGRDQGIGNREQVKPEPPAAPPQMQPPKNAFTGSLQDISSRWQEVLLAVRPLNHSLEGVLRSTRPVEFEQGWLTVEAFYKFHKERLEQDGHRRTLETAISNVLGGAIHLRFVLGEKGKVASDPTVENITAAVGDDELVRAAEEVFGK